MDSTNRHSYPRRNSVAKPLHFSVDPRLIELLGAQYRSTEEALKELVANAWGRQRNSSQHLTPRTSDELADHCLGQRLWHEPVRDRASIPGGGVRPSAACWIDHAEGAQGTGIGGSTPVPGSVPKPTLTVFNSPMRPLRTSSQACRNLVSDRCWLPTWKTRP